MMQGLANRLAVVIGALAFIAFGFDCVVVELHTINAFTRLMSALFGQ